MNYNDDFRNNCGKREQLEAMTRSSQASPAYDSSCQIRAVTQFEEENGKYLTARLPGIKFNDKW